jgi:hypothetical protein
MRPWEPPRLIGRWIAYPWRHIPAFDYTVRVGRVVFLHRPMRATTPFLSEMPTTTQALEVVRFDAHTIQWGRDQCIVYWADEDTRAQGQVALFVLASMLIELVAKIVGHSKNEKPPAP